MLYLQPKRSLYEKVPQIVNKLVVVLMSLMSMTYQKIEEELKELNQLPCIWYPIIFKDQIEALLNSKSEVNIMI